MIPDAALRAATPCIVGRTENQPGATEQFLPSLSQVDPAFFPQEQIHAKLAFERANLGAQRRLGNVKPGRGACEIELFGDCNEVTKVAQLHDPASISKTYRS
jgi:hypothetical protein